MLDEIRAIKLEELNRQKEENDAKISEAKKKYFEMKTQLWNLEYELSRGITVRGNFSFLDKLFSRRREYKRYKEQEKRMAELPEIISKLNDDLDAENARVDRELEADGTYADFSRISASIETVSRARNLLDLGVTPLEAIQILESRGIEPVLTEADKIPSKHPRNYSSKSSLIGVHKTKYPPTANIIKSAKDAKVQFSDTVEINGVTYEYSYSSPRDTVHMAMNDEVSSHMYGSWDTCKYAILIPFEDIPNEKIARVAPMDTFTRGSLDITENSWILCPKEEVKSLKAFNPKAHVLGYEGENVLGFSKPFLTQLGYRGEDVGMWSWSDDVSAKEFYELMEKENLKAGTHSHTYFHEDEEVITRMNKAISLAKLLRDKGLVKSQEDVPGIMEELEKSYSSFGYMLVGLAQKTSFESDIEPQAIVRNNRQADIFFEEMKKNGFDVSPTYQSVIRNLSKNSIYMYDRKNSEEVFGSIEGATDQERARIEELRGILDAKDFIYDSDKEKAFRNFLSQMMFDTILTSRERGIESQVPSKED